MATQLKFNKFNSFDQYGTEPKVKKLFNILKKCHTYVDFKPWGGGPDGKKGTVTHQAWHGLWGEDGMSPANWNDFRFLLDHLEKHTYPHNTPIISYWFKKYEPGQFFGLHPDWNDAILKMINNYNKIKTGPETKWYNTVTVVEADGEIIGGENIIAGTKEEPKKQLKVIKLEKLGDSLTWDNHTWHGLAEVHKGTRIILATLKPDNWDPAIDTFNVKSGPTWIKKKNNVYT